MCGIAGFYGFKDDALLSRMLKSIKHRGPDETGRQCTDFASIGTDRLSIVDVKGGSQPISNEDQNIWVSANCEIFNFPELRKKLEPKHEFATNTDTEVIIHAYEEYGEKTPEHLRGMFAFAILDNEKRQLFLARDHAGINPLYYYSNKKSGDFLFASEIKAILKHKEVSRKLDLNAMRDFFTLNYSPGTNTLIQGISKLMPGESLVVNKNGAKKRKYWQAYAEPAGSKTPEAALVKHLGVLLEDATSKWLMSDVPVGVSVSGGIDSAVIAAFASKHYGSKLHSYNVPFDEIDEKNAENVAEEFDTKHHILHLEQKHMELIPRMAFFNDCLISDPTVIPIYLISQAAKKDVKVLLTGESADELFAGYKLFSTLTSFEQKPMDSRPEKRWLRYVGTARDDFTSEEMIQFTKGKEENPAASFEPLKQYFYDQKLDHVNQISCLLFNNYLPHQLLNRLNVMMLANSVEGRTPFLDLRIVEFASKIPGSMKLKNGVEKWVFREAVKKQIPDQNRLAKKKPWTPSFLDVFGKDFASYATDLFDNAGLFKTFDRRFVEDILRRAVEKKEYVRQAWSIAMFGAWYDIFINRSKIKV